MRIYDRDLTGAAAESKRSQEIQRGEGGKTASGRRASAGDGDRVELSTGLGRLAQTLSSYGAERRGSVEALAALYREGGYQVDSGALSRALIDDALGAGRE